uniref:Sulfotransferase n=1 Tax=Leersia perrieri TaxID=77586 RepID=A0A0D9WV87_9ORYZ
MVADELFAARPSDIIVTTLPKSGTTWIKALLYATIVYMCRDPKDNLISLLHFLDYWHAHLAWPDRVLFFKYEEMKRDPENHLRRLAEFVGVPFTSQEEDDGVVDAIIRLCSFDNMVSLESTKGGSTRFTTATVPNSVFFRRGQVGDWENHLSPEMARWINAITEAKLLGLLWSGRLMFSW